MKFIAIKRKLHESAKLQPTLNTKLFTDDDKLKPEVVKALKAVAEEFISTLKETDIPVDVKDMWLVGSNAAYNYTDKSDIDLHLQADFDVEDCDPAILRILYDYARSSFNKDYDILIKGIPVEVYVEDIKSSSITNGVYSLNDNDWVRKPKKVAFEIVDITNTPEFKNTLAEYEQLQDKDVEAFLDKLYMKRKKALIKDGEFGLENLIFKEFRDRGLIKELQDRKHSIISKELSLENLRRGV